MIAVIAVIKVVSLSFRFRSLGIVYPALVRVPFPHSTDKGVHYVYVIYMMHLGHRQLVLRGAHIIPGYLSNYLVIYVAMYVSLCT